MKAPEFKTFAEMQEYINDDYFCCRIIFDPAEEDRWKGPPYLMMTHQTTGDDHYFEIPQTIAYYATAHAGYTWKSRERAEKQAVVAHIKKFMNP